MGSRAVARLAAAMLVAPARRSAVVTMLRIAARTAGAVPVRTLLASSPNETSRTFSGGQPADRLPRLGVSLCS